MTVQIHYHGHSCFSLVSGGTRLLLDPFLSGNPAADIKPAAAQTDFVLLSHAHGDHSADALDIVKRTGAPLICNAEMSYYAIAHGVDQSKAVGMNLGGAATLPFGRLKQTIAHHSSSWPDGTYGGNPAGFLFQFGGHRIYFAGDTALTYDMKWTGDEGVDIAFLPIGDYFTMGPTDALTSLSLLNPQVAVIPMHYNTFPPIKQDSQAFAEQVAQHSKARGIALTPGQQIEI